jgi:hypothetical protein
MPLTPEDHAFHEDLKEVLMKHQEGLRTTHIVAILAQVAGSTVAIEMAYEGMHVDIALSMIDANARIGITTGLQMIAEHHNVIN